ADRVAGDDAELLKVDDVSRIGAVLGHVVPRRLRGLDVEVAGGDGATGHGVAVAPQGEGCPAEEKCRACRSGHEAGRLLVHDRFSFGLWCCPRTRPRGRARTSSPSVLLGCLGAGQGPAGVTAPDAVHTIASPISSCEDGHWTVGTRSSVTVTSCRTVRPVLRTV